MGVGQGLELGCSELSAADDEKQYNLYATQLERESKRGRRPGHC